MAHLNQVEKSLGEQVADLLDRMPQNYDVTFSVGPDKIKVKAVKIILKAVSPVFQKEFDDTWENGVMKEGEGIPLPDVDPTIFETFVKLVTADTWSLDALNALHMSPNTKLSLLRFCRRYEITKAIQNLQQFANELVESFKNYKDTPDFLEMSQENLETIFACEDLPLTEKEVFECACRWSGNQCTLQGLEATGENYRKVLGHCLFEIRFPTMSVQEFTEVCLFGKDVLKDQEQLAVFLFIGLKIDLKKFYRTNYDTTQLQFKTNPRGVIGVSSFGISVLSLPQQYKLTTNPSFVCAGEKYHNDFQVMQKISLHGIGFLGPIDGDTQFDVTVQIKKYLNGSYTFDSGKLKKNIFARKGESFYFLFDEPIAVEPFHTLGGFWANAYKIYFWLKGASNISQYDVDDPRDESFHSSGVKFYLRSHWNSENPLAQLLFKKM